jgi:hypothetical protein
LAEPDREGFLCGPCGRFIVTAIAGLYRTGRRGSARRYCSAACRQAAYRRRRAGVPEDTPLQHRGGRGRGLIDAR